MLTIFSFAFALSTLSIFVNFLQARADIVESGNAGVSLSIQPVGTGPIAVVGVPPLSGEQEQKQPQPITSNPHVEFSWKKTLNLESRHIYDTQFPEFLGSSNLPNALIVIDVPGTTEYRISTIADRNGDWDVVSPQPIVPGLHRVTVTASDSNNQSIRTSESSAFEIILASGSTVVPQPNYPAVQPGSPTATLFDVYVRIPQQFKTIAPGDELLASIKLINFGKTGEPVDVPVRYQIVAPDGTTIAKAADTVAVATQASLVKSFYTSQALANGVYKLVVTVPSKDIMATASDSFEIKGAPVLNVSSTVRTDYTVVFEGLIALCFLFSIIIYFEYNKVTFLSKIIKEVDGRELAGFLKH